MILWRGVYNIFELPSFNLGIKTFLQEVGETLLVPKYVAEIFFYPLFVVLRAIAELNIDMSSISVTCEGSKAPFDLLLNFGILGISLSIIVSGYQYVWQVTLPTLNQSVFDHILTNEQFRLDKNLMKAMLSSVVLAFDPFQIFTRYLISLATTGKFVKNNGMHEITEGCDRVSNGLDSILGYTTSTIAWCILLPVVYLFANSIVPNYLPVPENDKVLTKALRRDKVEQINPFETSKKGQDNDGNKGKDREKPPSIFRLYLDLFSEYVMFFISVDLLLSYYARRWVNFIAKAQGMELEDNKINARFFQSRLQSQ
jgi:hypothetical protein